VVWFDRVPPPLEVHKIVPLEALAPLTVAVASSHIVLLPPAEAEGEPETLTVYVAVAFVHGVFVTVNVRVTAVPASEGAGSYVGVSVVALVSVPEPLEVHRIVPFMAEAPLTVAVSLSQIVCDPPAEAVGAGLTFIV
jgi:hypothetical protein